MTIRQYDRAKVADLISDLCDEHVTEEMIDLFISSVDEPTPTQLETFFSALEEITNG